LFLLSALDATNGKGYKDLGIHNPKVESSILSPATKTPAGGS
jgi:hypothetical protein